MAEITRTYSIDLTRESQRHYKATNGKGGSIEFGQGEGLMTPVEVLLAALAGCTAVDVDVVTSRRSEPTEFTVHVEGDRVNEEGASRLSDVRVGFTVHFPDDKAGQQAQGLVDNLIRISHEKDCTVSRTVEHETNVTFENLS
ncbi:OsmC family protein [Corynebacterium sp. S7]